MALGEFSIGSCPPLASTKRAEANARIGAKGDENEHVASARSRRERDRHARCFGRAFEMSTQLHEQDLLRHAHPAATALRPHELEPAAELAVARETHDLELDTAYRVMADLARFGAGASADEAVVVEHAPAGAGAAVVVRVRSSSWRMTGASEVEAAAKMLHHLGRTLRPRSRRPVSPEAASLCERGESLARSLDRRRGPKSDKTLPSFVDAAEWGGFAHLLRRAG
jgi:hypothetical protein